MIQSHHFYTFFLPVDKGTTNEIIHEEGKIFGKLRREDYAFMGDATFEELTPFLYFLRHAAD